MDCCVSILEGMACTNSALPVILLLLFQPRARDLSMKLPPRMYAQTQVDFIIA